MTVRLAVVPAVVLGLSAGIVAAQQGDALDDAVSEALNPPEAREQDTGGVRQASGAVLRGLDKVNADVTDMELGSGETAGYGRLDVRLRECRYPAGDPAGDAYAFVTVRDGDNGEELFSGWMIASSPALNALEHPRYDVWVLRCTTSE
ncbi:DUF2155 domain-containing protein [Roseovarius salis]|uniref:DUF2155 domain-containing protein n=1 Tax=Roseovarius salis TaxID=3376063 RepID=UPI0037C5F364